MMALAIGTLAPLHKSPEQQLMSHLVTETLGSGDLQKTDSSALHVDGKLQPLA